MSLGMMVGLIGLLYIVVFGGMGILRREGLSIRFAVEAVLITAIAVILVVLIPIQIHPILPMVLFILVLYVITLRVRILVDLANVFARRGNFDQAERIYDFTSHLWPDPTGELIIKVNHAILLLQKNQLEESISMFHEVLGEANKGYLGIKYEAAAHFNLGVAYLRSDNIAMATIEFNTTIDTWPASLPARRAQEALQRQRNRTKPQTEDKPADR